MADISILPEPVTVTQFILPILPFVMIGVLALGIFWFFWVWIKDHREKIRVIYFESEHEMRIIKVKVDDLSQVDLGDVGTFNLSKTKPLVKRSFLGKQSCYLIGQKTPMGLQLENNNIKPVYHPKILQGMIESKMARDVLLSDIGGKVFNPILILLGMGCGFAVCFMLISAGVLKI